jgi:predicted acetylornithine/succinylornithine family transaminase
MSSAETQIWYDRFVVGNYGRAPINIVRGAGSYVWDAEGRRYLDLLPGLGVGGLGHCPPAVTTALRNQLDKLLHIHNNYLWEDQARLAQALCEKAAGMNEPRAFFCNSGTEAGEASIKIARLHGRKAGRWKIIALENGFHGRSYGSLSATGQTSLQKGCGPLLPGFSFVPRNDIPALERTFDDETAALWVEPVQGEGGIFPCAKEYLQAARALCDKTGALLMYDEVQCGLGRTGDWYAYISLGAPPPDVLGLAKALGGGFPIGAILARKEASAAMVPGTHGSTFGGNSLACAAALAVIETINQENLLSHVRLVAEHFSTGLEKLRRKHADKICEIRQVGLMVGVELNRPGAPLVADCRNRGLLINCTHQTTLRFLPAINVKPEEIDEGLRIVDEAMSAPA